MGKVKDKLCFASRVLQIVVLDFVCRRAQDHLGFTSLLALQALKTYISVQAYPDMFYQYRDLGFPQAAADTRGALV